MPRTPHCNLRADSGFTAIEIIIVVTVLGIVVALAAPVLDSALVNSRLDAATVETVAIIEYAQARALGAGSPCRVFVDWPTETLHAEILVHTDAETLLDSSLETVPSDDAESVDYSPLEDPLRPGAACKLDYPANGVRLADADVDADGPLEFSPLGIPSTSAYIELSSGGRKRAVYVDVDTGKVRYEDL